MGVTLYRPGKTHIVNGIQCELRVFSENSYLTGLQTGWFISPGECYLEKNEENPVNDDEIRQLAKEAKIKSWHVKKIDRLKKELEECQII